METNFPGNPAKKEFHLPSCGLISPVILKLLVLLGEPSPVSLDHTICTQSQGEEVRVDRVFDSIINVAASCNRSSSSDSVNNTIVFASLADLTADTLRFAVLSKGRGSGEVAEAVDALEPLVAVGRGLQVLDKGNGGLVALTVRR